MFWIGMLIGAIVVVPLLTIVAALCIAHHDAKLDNDREEF